MLQELLDSAFIKTSQRSFKFYMQSVVGLTNPPFLNDLDDVLSDPIYKKVVAAYPRGHGKSTHLSIGYPTWKIAQNHNLRILIVSNTATVSQGFLRGIVNQIENNEKYQQFAKFCDPKGVGVKPKMMRNTNKEEKWSGNGITIERDDYTLKDPTIQALGLFGPIISKRADIIIADDIVDQKNSETEEQRQKIKDWIYTTLLPVLVPGGQFIYLGNTWNANDVVADMLKDPQFEFRSKLKSIIEEPRNPELWHEWAKIRLNEDVDPHERLRLADEFYAANREKMDDGVKVLWPERNPFKDLYLLRMSNAYSFARMYQCDPSSRPNQKIQEVWLNKAKEKGMNLKLQDDPREGITTDLTVSGMDLAISLKETADDTVLLTIDRVKYGNEIIQPGDYIIRNIRRGKMTPNDVRVMVKNHNDHVRPNGIRVESVAYQESMVRDLQDLGHINVRGHKTGGEKNDINIGVNSIAIMLENGRLVLPYDMQDPRTIQLINELCDEMRSWPEGHTGDALMALWFAVLESRDFMGKRFIIPSSPPTVGIPSNEDFQKAALDLDLAQIKLSDRERQTGSNNNRQKGFVF